MDIDRISTVTEKLLYEILQELRNLNSSDNICQLCGKDHKLPGIAGTCAKKHGKGGVKK